MKISFIVEKGITFQEKNPSLTDFIYRCANSCVAWNFIVEGLKRNSVYILNML